ncbi:hypothetical protein LCGC14_1992110, partial [marine sediment metagenome]
MRKLGVYDVAALAVLAVGVSAALLAGCSSEQENSGRTKPSAGELTIDYPLDGTLFPPDIVAPTFRWTDGGEAPGDELEKLADSWADLIARHGSDTTFVLNADDPLVADLGRTQADGLRPRVLFFGAEDGSHALPEPEHAFDAKHCRRCGHAYSYSATYLGHLGDYRCSACGNERPTPQVTAERIELQGMSGSRILLDTPKGKLDIRLPLPGLYNVYNALAATACCLALDIEPAAIERGLQ